MGRGAKPEPMRFLFSLKCADPFSVLTFLLTNFVFSSIYFEDNISLNVCETMEIFEKFVLSLCLSNYLVAFEIFLFIICWHLLFSFKITLHFNRTARDIWNSIRFVSLSVELYHIISFFLSTHHFCGIQNLIKIVHIFLLFNTEPNTLFCTR